MKNNNYTWCFWCSDNGGKRQAFKVKASDKPKAIEKGFKKALKNSAGDITNWDCKLQMIF